jgi:hypothetical protein
VFGAPLNWTTVWKLTVILIDKTLASIWFVLRRGLTCRIFAGTDSRGPSQLAVIKLGLASAVLAGVKA